MITAMTYIYVRQHHWMGCLNGLNVYVPTPGDGSGRWFIIATLLSHSAGYEIDFALAYNKLGSLGAKFNPDAYLYPIDVLDVNL